MAEDDLTEWELQEMRDMERKVSKYQAHRMTEFARQKEGQIQNEVLKEVSEEFGMSPEEVQRTLATVADPEEAETAAQLYREGLKDFVRQRLAGKAKKTPGNKMQDEKGRFTSPKKQASERAYAQKVAEMKERVQRGGRLSEDELLEIMPRLR